MSEDQNSPTIGFTGCNSRVSVTLPTPLIALVDRVAQEQVQSRATILRDLVIHALADKGLRPIKTVEASK